MATDSRAGASESVQVSVPEEEKIKHREIEELFAQLDSNKDGVLDAEELRVGLKKLGHHSDGEDVKVRKHVSLFFVC